MKVRMLQQLTVNGVTFPAGKEADLPTNVAICCLRRGTAQRADLPYENRVEAPPQNRVEGPTENRGTEGDGEPSSEVPDEGEPEKSEESDESDASAPSADLRDYGGHERRGEPDEGEDLPD